MFLNACGDALCPKAVDAGVAEVPPHRNGAEVYRPHQTIQKRSHTMITITPTAEEKIRELMQEEKDTVGLRVFVKGGGCHGYQYGICVESFD